MYAENNTFNERYVSQAHFKSSQASTRELFCTIFVFELFSQKSFIVDVRLGSKFATRASLRLGCSFVKIVFSKIIIQPKNTKETLFSFQLEMTAYVINLKFLCKK